VPDIIYIWIKRNGPSEDCRVKASLIDEVIDKGGEVVADNDNESALTLNSSINDLVLDAGTYSIEVTVPDVEGGNTSNGYYQLIVSAIDDPVTALDRCCALGEINYPLTETEISENLADAKQIMDSLARDVIISDIMLRDGDTATIRLAKKIGLPI
jgi:CheY-like chemotaxis protein